jgi:hypothetical protein
MASGFQGKAKPAANTWNNIYTIPTGKVASFSVNASNQGSTSSGIDIVISTASSSGSIAATEYIEFGTPVAPNGGSVERTGLVSDDTNGKYIWIRSTTADVAFQVYGYEE